MRVPAEAVPNVHDLTIEDGAPAPSIFVAMQRQLLVEPLYTSWKGLGEGRPFQAYSNVGLFYSVNEPPLVPDVMLSLDTPPADLSRRENLSYFVWLRGKVPDVAIEIVAGIDGGEDSRELERYARVRIPYVVVFDPVDLLGNGVLRAFVLHGLHFGPTNAEWFEGVGLGLKLWRGKFAHVEYTWLRWCDRQGSIIPTGAELADSLTKNI